MHHGCHMSGSVSGLLHDELPSCSSPTPLWSDQQQRHGPSSSQWGPSSRLSETEQEFLRLLEGPGQQALRAPDHHAAAQQLSPLAQAEEPASSSNCSNAPSKVPCEVQAAQPTAVEQAAAAQRSPPAAPLQQPPFYPAGRSTRVPVKTAAAGSTIIKGPDGRSPPQPTAVAEGRLMAATFHAQGMAGSPQGHAASSCLLKVSGGQQKQQQQQQQQQRPSRRFHGALFHGPHGSGHSPAAAAAPAQRSPRPPPPSSATPAAAAAGHGGRPHPQAPLAAGEDLLALGHLLGTLSSWQVQRRVLLGWRGVAQVQQQARQHGQYQARRQRLVTLTATWGAWRAAAAAAVQEAASKEAAADALAADWLAYRALKAWWGALQQAQQQRAQQRQLLARCLCGWAALSQQRCLALEAAEAGVVPYAWRLAAAALAAWRQQAQRTRELLAHSSRCRLGRCLAAWQQHASIHSALQEAAAQQQYSSRLRHRALVAWWGEYLPAARTRRLLIDAATTVAEGLALSRQLQLQQQVLLGWREEVLAVQQRRQAAGWLLQQAWRRGLVLSWRAAAVKGRTSWAAKEAAAAQYAARMLLLRGWRGWVRAWSVAGCVRVMQQKQLRAAALSCLSAWRTSTTQQQQRRAAAAAAAADARQRKLLAAGWRLWRGWLRCRVQGRDLVVDLQLRRQAAVLAQWQAATRHAAGLRACEAAAASFWRTRCLASCFSCWLTASHQAQLAAAAAAEQQQQQAAITGAPCAPTQQQQQQQPLVPASPTESQEDAEWAGVEQLVVRTQQHRLLAACWAGWWELGPGRRKAVEHQVTQLVRLVARCFRSWRQMTAAAAGSSRPEPAVHAPCERALPVQQPPVSAANAVQEPGCKQSQQQQQQRGRPGGPHSHDASWRSWQAAAGLLEAHPLLASAAASPTKLQLDALAAAAPVVVPTGVPGSKAAGGSCIGGDLDVSCDQDQAPIAAAASRQLASPGKQQQQQDEGEDPADEVCLQLLLQCLCSWREYAEHKQQERTVMALVLQHRRVSVCHRALCLWRGEAAAGASLAQQQRQRQAAVLSELLQAAAQRQRVRQWVSRRRLQPVVEAWRGWVKGRATIAWGFACYNRQRRAFRRWRAARQQQQQQQLRPPLPVSGLIVQVPGQGAQQQQKQQPLPGHLAARACPQQQQMGRTLSGLCSAVELSCGGVLPGTLPAATAPTQWTAAGGPSLALDQAALTCSGEQQQHTLLEPLPPPPTQQQQQQQDPVQVPGASAADPLSKVMRWLEEHGVMGGLAPLGHAADHEQGLELAGGCSQEGHEEQQQPQQQEQAGAAYDLASPAAAPPSFLLDKHSSSNTAAPAPVPGGPEWVWGPGLQLEQRPPPAAISSNVGAVVNGGGDVWVTAGPAAAAKPQGAGVTPFVSPAAAGALGDVGQGLRDQVPAGQVGPWGSGRPGGGSVGSGSIGKQQQQQPPGADAAGPMDALEQLLLLQAGADVGSALGAAGQSGVWPAWLSPPRQAAAGLPPATRAMAGRHSWQGGGLGAVAASVTAASGGARALQSGPGLLSSKGLLHSSMPTAGAAVQMEGLGLGASISHMGTSAAGASLDAYMAILQE